MNQPSYFRPHRRLLLKNYTIQRTLPAASRSTARRSKDSRMRKSSCGPAIRTDASAGLKRKADLSAVLAARERRTGFDDRRSRVYLQRERNSSELRRAVLNINRETVASSRAQWGCARELPRRSDRQPDRKSRGGPGI